MQITDENIEDINQLLKVINDFNNGNDSLVYDVEEIFEAIKKYSNTIYGNYLKFYLIELYLNVSIHIVNWEMAHSSDYIRLMDYCQSDLKFYLDSATELRRYVKKVKKTGEVDKLDYAYLLTIYLSQVLDNIQSYTREITTAIDFYADGLVASLRKKALLDIDEVNKLLVELKKEGN